MPKTKWTNTFDVACMLCWMDERTLIWSEWCGWSAQQGYNHCPLTDQQWDYQMCNYDNWIKSIKLSWKKKCRHSTDYMSLSVIKKMYIQDCWFSYEKHVIKCHQKDSPYRVIHFHQEDGPYRVIHFHQEESPYMLYN